MAPIELNALPTAVRQVLPARIKSAVREHLNRPLTSFNEQAISPPLPPHQQQTKEQILQSWAQYLVACYTLFTVGFNDASAGPLLPRMQKAYKISFLVVSLLFIFSCIGYVIGAYLNVFLSERVAFGKLLVLSCALQMLAFTLISTAPPFPVFNLGYFVNGVGSSILMSQVNGYLVTMGGNINRKVAVTQAAYGTGAFVAPLVATQFSTIRHWSFHFLVSLGMVTTNAILSSVIFRFQSREGCRAKIGLEPIERDASEHSPFRHILSSKSVHLLSLFIFLYVGTEVTIGGWTVTYIIQQRDAGTNSGYIASGFWGGITVGRIILIPLNSWLGDRLAMVVYILFSIGLEIVVWVVPSLIGNAVAVSLVGLFFGPMFPVGLSTSRKIIPRWIYTGAVGWIIGLGQSGSAGLPFLAGAMADAVGISSLQPLLVGLMASMLVVWLIVPRPTRPD